MDFTESHKKEIEKQIVEAIITSLDKDNLKTTELPNIANFVLERIDNIKTHNELILFLGELARIWPVFVNLTAIEKGEVKEIKEDEVAQSVLTLAKSGKIDEAINLAKTMTGG